MTRQRSPRHRDEIDAARVATTQRSTALHVREIDHANGYTEDGHESWGGGDDRDDQRLIAAATGRQRERGVFALGSVTERIDGGRLLILFDGTRAGLRLYLDELSGVIYTVASTVVSAKDMRELITDHRGCPKIRNRRGVLTSNANARPR